MRNLDIEAIYELSPVQKGMLFHSVYAPHSGVYVAQLSIRLEGALDVDAFEQSWRRVLARHGALRTTLHWEELDKPVQVVHKDVPLPLVKESWLGVSEEVQVRRLKALLCAERERGFDLEKAPLLRLNLFEVDEEVHQLVWSFHHLCLDGWSFGLIFRELFRVYEAQVTGGVAELAPAPQYRSYIGWLQNQGLESAESFWRRQLKDLPPAALPEVGSSGIASSKAPRPEVSLSEAASQSGDRATTHREYGELRCILSPPVTARLESLCRGHRLTLNTLLVGVWAVLLWRYCRQRDVVFGVTVSGRPAELAGVGTMVGLFVNSLPVRVRLPLEESLGAWLEVLQREQAELRRFEHSPLDEVQRWSGRPADHPLFEHLVAVENYPLNAALEQASQAPGGLRVSGFEATEQTNYPLNISLIPGHETQLSIAFDRRSFRNSAVERMLGHLSTLLSAVPENLGRDLSGLPMLSPAEEHQLQVEWVGRSDASAVGTIHRWIVEQAARTPSAIAAEAAGGELSYSSLVSQSWEVANRLRNRGVGPETLVGLLVDRSLAFPVGLLGIWLSGGAVLPLDPALPTERLELLLADAAPRVVVAAPGLVERLPPGSARMVEIVAGDSSSGLVSSSKGRFETSLQTGPESSDSLAYVVYTSGSTGRPKGVQIPHGALVNFGREMARRFRLRPTDRILQFSALGFNVIFEEIVPTWLSGAAVVFEEGLGELACADLHRRIEALGITGLELPAAYWHEWVRELEEAKARPPAGLRFLLLGCEKPIPERVESWRGFGVPLIFVFGLTETTVTSSLYETPAAGTPIPRDLPIGRPVANTRMAILDRQLRSVPMGVVGELYIGGLGVARGYGRQPAMTAERFVPNPLTGQAGSRLYRTGDLARTLEDGNVDFLGRADFQIKIRGFRVEPGEIEAALVRHPGIREAAVVARGGSQGTRRLLAYVVGEEGLRQGEVLDRLRNLLPEYMVPATLGFLEALPLTRTGKVDRKALLNMDEGFGEGSLYVAPTNSTEQELVDIWAEVLCRPRVGIEDNFFALGGDSIVSLQIISRARQVGLQLAPRQLFENPTVASLAAVATQAEEASAEQGPVTGPAPLTPVQHWFFESALPPTPGHWNLPLLLACSEPLDTYWLSLALSRLVEHHDALRLRFWQTSAPSTRASWGAEISAPEKASFETRDLSSMEARLRPAALTKAAGEAQQSLDLTEGPLFRALYFTYRDGGEDHLLLVAHHLVVDGVSWRILVEDLTRLYHQLSQGEAPILPAKSTSYQRWGEALREFAAQEEITAETNRWLATVSSERMPLPLDGEGRGEVATSEYLETVLEASTTRNLLERVPPVYRTEINDALLAALAGTLTAWAGGAVLVELEGHGREEVMPGLDVSRTVGWFTAQYPVLLERWRDDPGEALREVKERLRAFPRRGMDYGALRYLAASGEPDSPVSALQASPHPQVLFNYLGQLDPPAGQEEMFRLAEISPGASLDPEGSRTHLLEINAGVRGGRLEVRWTFGRNQHHRETVAQLASDYLNRLRSLVEHCLQPNVGGYTPSDFPLAALDQGVLDQLLGEDREVEDLYPLAPMQEGMAFHARLEPEGGLYVAQSRFELTGRLDPAVFREAWRRTIERHPSLRVNFRWAESGRPFQVVRRGVSLSWRHEDWRDLSPGDQKKQLDDLLERDIGVPLDLSRGPLQRFVLVRTGKQGYTLLWSYFQGLLDGWSLPVLFADLFRAYRALARGGEPSFAPRAPYRRYVEWLQHRDLEAAEAYWRDQFEGFETPLPLAPSVAAPEGARIFREELREELRPQVDHRLSERFTLSLTAMARRRGLTLNTLVQGAWAVLLQRYCAADDVVFGVTTSGRPADLPGVESMVGVFINTVPVRVRCEASMQLWGWLKDLQQQQSQLREFEYAPLAEVQRWAGAQRGNALFDNLLVFENYPFDEALARQETGVLVRPISPYSRSNYPLTLLVIPGQELQLTAKFQTQRWSRLAIERLMGHLTVILRDFPSERELHLGQLDLLTSVERQQLLWEWNSWSPSRTVAGIAERFAQQVEAQPEAAAVVFENRVLTFRQLDHQANQLAHWLRWKGLAAEAKVGIYLDRGLEMVVAVLGAIKAGAAYVPLDPRSPSPRLSFLLDDSGVELVLTEKRLAEGLAAACPILALDVARDDLARQPKSPPSGGRDPRRLLYVCYTSGSTGRPKGVMVEERQVLVYLEAVDQLVGNARRGHYAMLQPLTVDSCLTVLFPPFVLGGCLHLISEDRALDPPALADYFARHGIDVLKIAPSHLRALQEGGAGLAVLPKRVLIVGGEASPTRWFQELRTQAPKLSLFNHYGPTETTVGVTALKASSQAALTGPTVPIGSPLAGTVATVLDPHLRLVPVGVKGELYLGGQQISRGYLGRPALTAASFLPDPFSPYAGSRLYRTGDRVRQLESSEIQFLGRFDHQLKIRGQRVETGEIEAALRRHPWVAAAVVANRPGEDEQPRLVAYVELPGREEDDTAIAIAITEFLRGELPEAMVPAVVMPVPRLARSRHGKIDLAALPDPGGAPSRGAPFQPPATETEQKLAAIWSEVLGPDRVGIHDNFFDLGGHSLRAVQIVSRIRQVFGRDLRLARLLENPTIAGVVSHLEEADEVHLDTIPRASRQGRRMKRVGQGALVSQGRVRG